MISEKLRSDLLDYLVHIGASVKQAQDMVRKEPIDPLGMLCSLDHAPALDPMRQAMRDLQAFLVTQGVDPGPVDGVYGPRTGAALREYQKRVALAPFWDVAGSRRRGP